MSTEPTDAHADFPPYLSWRVAGGAVGTARVWSVSVNGWHLQSADGYSWLTDRRPTGWRESTAAEVSAWQRRALAPSSPGR